MTASNVLLTIVVICVSCHFLKTCLNVVELIICFTGNDLYNSLKSSVTINILSVVSNFLIIINSCSNFFVYLVKDPKFLLSFKKSVLRSSENSSSSGSRNETFSLRRNQSLREERRSRRRGVMIEMTALQINEAVAKDNVSTSINTLSSNPASSSPTFLSVTPLQNTVIQSTSL